MEVPLLLLLLLEDLLLLLLLLLLVEVLLLLPLLEDCTGGSTAAVASRKGGPVSVQNYFFMKFTLFHRQELGWKSWRLTLLTNNMANDFASSPW